MDAGKLCVGVVISLPTREDVSVMQLAQVRALHEWETSSIRLESDQLILAGLDGEAVEFASPLDVSTHSKGLRVLVPAGTRPGCIPVGEKVAARLLDMAELGGPLS